MYGSTAIICLQKILWWLASTIALIRAIRLKYGSIGQEHSGELIPHLHLQNKSELILTEEYTFTEFIKWIKEKIDA